jgi:hypothetical protein
MTRFAFATLADGIMTAHPDMPQVASPSWDVAAIIASPESIQRL